MAKKIRPPKKPTPPPVINKKGAIKETIKRMKKKGAIGHG